MTATEIPQHLPAVRVKSQLGLSAGILASVLYLAMITVIRYHGYDPISQVPSELTAIDAPTRDLWFWLGLLYTVLAITFAWGVRAVARETPRLRVVGVLLLLLALLGFVWPFAPMHQREILAAGGETFGDKLHRVLGIITAALFVLTLGFGAFAFGKRFRLYSLTTLGIAVVTGVLVGVNAPRLAAGLPTPLIGLWERINITVCMVWEIVLAIVLLRQFRTGPQESP
jgi:uncharacterized protein DUF998